MSLSVRPSHPPLLPLGSFYHMNLPRPPCPPQPSPPAASRPLPHLARRVPHECQAGIQGVCRRASLTGSAGAAPGRPCCPDSPGSQRQKHAVLIGWSRPPCPLLTGAGCPIRSLRRVRGPVTCCDVWNAFIVGFCTPVPSSRHAGVDLDPFVHPCVARVLIFSPPPFLYILYPSC